jgi:hypothetical protein
MAVTLYVTVGRLVHGCAARRRTMPYDAARRRTTPLAAARRRTTPHDCFVLPTVHAFQR